MSVDTRQCHVHLPHVMHPLSDQLPQPPAPARLPSCQGNLCWDAALEVSLAAASVHAPVMDPTGKTLDPK